MTRYEELQMLAQRSAEERLSLAVDSVWEDDPEHPAYAIMAGPFCGCDTCVVREIIDAAWPFLKEIALMEGPDGPR